MEYKKLIDSINKIVLSKEEERKEFIPKFIELYGNPQSEQVVAKDSYYLNKLRETIEQYKMVERIRFFSRKGYVVDPKQIDITEEYNRAL